MTRPKFRSGNEFKFWHLTNAPEALAGSAGSIVCDLGKTGLQDLPPHQYVAPFSSGIRLKLPGPACFRVTPNLRLHPLMMYDTAWIAEQELAEEIGLLLGDQVQLIDCASDSEKLNRYKVLNFLQVLDCIDFDRSYFDFIGDSQDPNALMVLRRIFVDESKVPKDALIFRPAPAPGFAIATAKAKKALQKLGIAEGYFDRVIMGDQ